MVNSHAISRPISITDHMLLRGTRSMRQIAFLGSTAPALVRPLHLLGARLAAPGSSAHSQAEAQPLGAPGHGPSCSSAPPYLGVRTRGKLDPWYAIRFRALEHTHRGRLGGLRGLGPLEGSPGRRPITSEAVIVITK